MLDFTPELVDVGPANNININTSYDSPQRGYPAQASPEVQAVKRMAQLEYYNPPEVRTISGPPTFDMASTHPYTRSEYANEVATRSTQFPLGNKHSYFSNDRYSDLQRLQGLQLPSRHQEKLHAATK